MNDSSSGSTGSSSSDESSSSSDEGGGPAAQPIRTPLLSTVLVRSQRLYDYFL